MKIIVEFEMSRKNNTVLLKKTVTFFKPVKTIGHKNFSTKKKNTK